MYFIKRPFSCNQTVVVLSVWMLSIRIKLICPWFFCTCTCSTEDVFAPAQYKVCPVFCLLFVIRHHNVRLNRSLLSSISHSAPQRPTEQEFFVFYFAFGTTTSDWTGVFCLLFRIRHHNIQLNRSFFCKFFHFYDRTVYFSSIAGTYIYSLIDLYCMLFFAHIIPGSSYNFVCCLLFINCHVAIPMYM